MCDSTSAAATAANSSGTQIPSLRPLSMFNPWRIRLGTRGSRDDRLAEGGVGRRQDDPEDDGFPDRQHVEDHARRERSEGDRQRQPDSEQTQRHRESRRSFPKSMREASEKSTSASVASASARTVELVLEISIPSRTLGPTRSLMETNRIAGVIGDPDSRLRPRQRRSAPAPRSRVPNQLSSPRSG